MSAEAYEPLFPPEIPGTQNTESDYMPDKAALAMAEPQPKRTPALSATSDMPDAPLATPPAISEQVVDGEKVQAKTPEPKPNDPPPPENPDVPTPEGEQPPEQAGDIDPLTSDKTPDWLKELAAKERNKARGSDAARKVEAAARKAAEAEAKDLKDNLTKALSALEALTPAMAAKQVADLEKTDPQPRRETFDDPNAYEREFIAWSDRRSKLIATTEAKAAIEAERQAAKDADLKAETDKKNKEIADKYAKRVEKFTETHPDFEEVVVREDLPLSIPMSHAILNGDDGPAIAYYLGKNQDEAERISQLDPINAIYELGRISQRLSAKPAKPNLPSPINSLRSANANATRKTAADESMEEYGRRRSAELMAERKPFIGNLAH